jgi:transcriptional regulator with XRE-family HTH domain
MAKQYIVRLKDAHKKAKLTKYAVARDTGLNYNTVNKYLSDEVRADVLPAHVITICEFLHLDWHDPAVIEVIDVEDESSGKFKTPLIALA